MKFKKQAAIRTAYLFLWIFAIYLAFPKRGEVFNAATCAVFICVFLSAVFSNVLNYWVLWILPVLFFIAALIVNFHKLKRFRFWSISCSMTIASVFMLHAISYALPRDVKILKYGDEISVGKGDPNALILSPVGNTLGAYYGRELKEFLVDKNFSVEISTAIKKQRYEFAIVSSDFDAKTISDINAENIYILNSMPQNVESSNLNGNSIEVLLGDMSDWRRKRYWQNFVEKNPQVKLTILLGVGDYIPDWPKLLDGTFEFPKDEE